MPMVFFVALAIGSFFLIAIFAALIALVEGYRMRGSFWLIFFLLSLGICAIWAGYLFFWADLIQWIGASDEAISTVNKATRKALPIASATKNIIIW